jgi:hypothetical protein
MKLGIDRNDFSFYVLKNMFIFVSVFPFVLFGSLEIIYHIVQDLNGDSALSNEIVQNVRTGNYGLCTHHSVYRVDY